MVQTSSKRQGRRIMPWPHKNKPRTGRRKIGSTKRANRRKNRKQAKK